MKKLLLLLAAVAALGTAGKKDPPLIPSCDPCSVNEVFTINGSGFQSGTLDVVVWGSPVPVTCAPPNKGGSFTCSTSIPLAGTFNIVAYDITNKWATIGSTWVTVE